MKNFSKPQDRILIVDDDKSVCETLQTLLSASYHCEYVTRIEDAQALLSQENKFNVLLLDLSFPEGTGDSLVDELQGTETQVIVLTMHSDLKRATELMSRGAFYYLTKESPPSEILHRVTLAVARSHEKTKMKNIDARLNDLEQEVSQLPKSLREELWHFRKGSALLDELAPGIHLKKVLQEFEKRILLSALQKYDWRRHVTAKALGMHINTLLLKLKRYGLTKRAYSKGSSASAK